MAWDQGYTSPEERAAQDRAEAEARSRSRMQPFERRLLDYLGEISASLATIAGTCVLNSDAVRNPTSPLVAGSSSEGRGAPEPTADEGHHSAPGDTGPSSLSAARALFTAAGVDGGVSAEPVDRAGPGSAHPTPQPQ